MPQPEVIISCTCVSNVILSILISQNRFHNSQIHLQGRRNSIISGEATKKKFGTFALFPKKISLVNSQPLISGEALASWLHLFLRPCLFYCINGSEVYNVVHVNTHSIKCSYQCKKNNGSKCHKLSKSSRKVKKKYQWNFL